MSGLKTNPKMLLKETTLSQMKTVNSIGKIHTYVVNKSCCGLETLFWCRENHKMSIHIQYYC